MPEKSIDTFIEALKKETEIISVEKINDQKLEVIFVKIKIKQSKIPLSKIRVFLIAFDQKSNRSVWFRRGFRYFSNFSNGHKIQYSYNRISFEDINIFEIIVMIAVPAVLIELSSYGLAQIEMNLTYFLLGITIGIASISFWISLNLPKKAFATIYNVVKNTQWDKKD